MPNHPALTVTILGCGPSAGVPLIGCPCTVCGSADRRNRRSRASILVEKGDTRVLIDTAPDLREQALRAGFRTVDAILYTHAHADHCHGIDDARSFNYHRDGVIPVIGMRETLEEIRQRFGYAFHAPVKDQVWIRPSLELQEINEYDEFTVGNIDFLNYLQWHGKTRSLGYRTENIAYSTDVDKIPEQSAQLLEKLDVWIVDCLREEPSPTHAHLAQTLAWIERFTPRLAVLTHMAHEFDYATLAGQLPPGVIPAYDGMRIRVEAGVVTVDGALPVMRHQ
jgi:phosphoribosyl 1,2-cyclic phosphate phosphodiesterase